MKCPSCDNGLIKCPQCKGQGTVFGMVSGTLKCTNCGGSGKVKCPNCNGKGSI